MCQLLCNTLHPYLLQLAYRKNIINQYQMTSQDHRLPFPHCGVSWARIVRFVTNRDQVVLWTCNSQPHNRHYCLSCSSH